MQSISHWGMFEMQAQGTDAFKETLAAAQRPLGTEFQQVLTDNLWDLYVRAMPIAPSRNTPMSFFVSRQDTTENTKA